LKLIQDTELTMVPIPELLILMVKPLNSPTNTKLKS